MLVHQLPPDPPGLRMRVWRRLQQLGALQVKGSVYVLPATEVAQEDLQWLLGEIRGANAEGSLWRARCVDGIDDDDLVLRFQASVAAEYEPLEADAKALRDALARRRRPALARGEAARRLARLRARFEQITRRDYFDAPRRELAGALLAEIEAALKDTSPDDPKALPHGTLDPRAYRGRTWATRAQVRIDRMASAWLIRRFIDPDARFAFTTDTRRAPVAGALRFDMYAGEFTHEAGLCTFEVLVRRFALDQPGLARIAEIVHDIDLKESLYAHEETPGVAASLEAIAEGVGDDPGRIAHAGTVFDGLLRRFARVAAST
ncbi:MAG TPA: chromate resistance protein ChrB domain-containing protein [Candidatus Saccharimonadia bacterium]|nr:chromate resistance protein ChrB domain-containing protein [Candidatus Saccharimonadia bacterium]